MLEAVKSELSNREVKEALLAQIRDFGPEFEAASRQAELERTLPTRIVAFLRESGLFWLKVPRAVGGGELDPLEFCDVLEQVAYYDASAAWAVMIANGAAGDQVGWMPEEGAAVIFADPSALPVFAGQYVPNGRATRVEGGYRVSGKWGFGSGIMHADWVVAGCVLEGEQGVFVNVCFPKSQVQVADTWYVAGLQGTGSNNYSVDDVFVPDAFTFLAGAPARRSEPLFQVPTGQFVANELPPLMCGLARRAIDDMLDLAGSTSRMSASMTGSGKGTIAERAVFQRAIGRSEARLSSVRAMFREILGAIWDRQVRGEEVGDELLTAQAAASTYCAETCLEIVAELFRYGGGRALSLDHPMQRHYRNLIAANQHVILSDVSYERAGRERLDTRAAARAAS